MRNKKAKMLRRFARRFTAMQGLPDKSYTVRNRTVQLDGCARKFYQLAKRTI